MRYPRVDVFKRKKHIPTYQEFFIVDTMRPNRPKCSKCWKTKLQADAWKSHTNLTHPGKVF